MEPGAGTETGNGKELRTGMGMPTRMSTWIWMWRVTRIWARTKTGTRTKTRKDISMGRSKSRRISMVAKWKDRVIQVLSSSKKGKVKTHERNI